MRNSYVYLLAPFIGWVVAQAAKVIINASRLPNRGFAKYMSSGEMPSAHTAVVMALISAIYIREGITELFALSVCFAAIVIYDALVARRSIGEQGVALQKLLKDAKYKGKLPVIALGHKPLEVLVGAGIGIIVGVFVAIFTSN